MRLPSRTGSMLDKRRDSGTVPRNPEDRNGNEAPVPESRLARRAAKDERKGVST